MIKTFNFVSQIAGDAQPPADESRPQSDNAHPRYRRNRPRGNRDRTEKNGRYGHAEKKDRGSNLDHRRIGLMRFSFHCAVPKCGEIILKRAIQEILSKGAEVIIHRHPRLAALGLRA